MTEDRGNSGIIALAITVLGFLGFLAFLVHSRNQRNYKATTATEYDSVGRPVKIEEKVNYL